MSVIDEVVSASSQHQAAFANSDLPTPPARGLAIVTCMDARIETGRLFGLDEGDAHVIRNAGGVVTADALRSLAISQRLLGTRSIMIVTHTGCGMLTFDGDDFRRSIEAETGARPTWATETFSDPAEEARQGIARVKADAAVPHTDDVRGFVYDVKTGGLVEVVTD